MCRGHEMSGHMAMIPGVQPSNIPWPEHSFSVAVESFVKGAKSMQKWEVHFFAPGLAVWTLPMPWVSAVFHNPKLTSISCAAVSDELKLCMLSLMAKSAQNWPVQEYTGQ